MIQQAELSPGAAAAGRRNLFANLARAASANAFGLLVGLAVGLFLPRYLTFAEYSKYQTFNFYSLYLVVLQFGFTTGLYIKYGGKRQADIDRRTFTAELSLLLLLLAAATVIGLAIGLALSSPVLEAIALFLLPFNVIQCYKLLYQATGDFRRYSLLQSVEGLSIGVVAFLFMALRRHDAAYLIWGRVLLSAGLAGVLLRPWWRYLRCVTWAQIFSQSNLRIAQVGLLVMLGGFSSMFVHTVDRWFVKVLLTDTDFALYSFAIAMYGALSTVTNSLAMTFYPAFAGGGLAGPPWASCAA
jgi:O-antigen/teichoic acid export membrane protein